MRIWSTTAPRHQERSIRHPGAYLVLLARSRLPNLPIQPHSIAFDPPTASAWQGIHDDHVRSSSSLHVPTRWFAMDQQRGTAIRDSGDSAFLVTSTAGTYLNNATHFSWSIEARHLTCPFKPREHVQPAAHKCVLPTRYTFKRRNTGFIAQSVYSLGYPSSTFGGVK